MTPHFSKIPTDPAAHAAFRLDLYRRAARSRSLRALLKRYCEEDLLFWVNTFGWTYAPVLHPECPIWPSLLWSFQNKALTEINEAIGIEDIKFKKSRDMLATWMCIYLFTWRARFMSRESFGMMSRKAELVDGDGEGSLFSKIDFLLEQQARVAPWLNDGRFDRKQMYLRFKDSGGSITGEPTTGDAFRGDRKTAILLDEYNAFELKDGYLADAATMHATDSRLFNFTAKGAQGAAWELDRKEGVRTVELWWWQHPHKAEGLYVSDGNNPQPDFRGKRRSPWYDRKCKQAINPKDILAELDGEWVGTSDAFFPSDLIDSFQQSYCLSPYSFAELFHDDAGQPDELVICGDGKWRLWFHPYSEFGKLTAPADREYAIGVDISAGTGRSDSVIVVADKATNEKVAEYIDNTILPHALAAKAAAAARYFRAKNGEPARIIWESNGGPGRNFRDGLMAAPVGFNNVYYRREPKGAGFKTTETPGYHANTESQRALIEAYKTALIRKQFIDRSHETLEECRMYVYDGKAVVHQAALRTAIDPSGSGVNHGDRVRATALCWHLMSPSTRRAMPEPRRHVPSDSLAARREHFKQQRREMAYGGW